MIDGDVMLNQLLAFFIKELRLLRRDRGGLVVLFVMPVALVIIVSLVQDNILKVSGATTVKLVLVDADHASQSKASLGETLLHQLNASGSFQVTHFNSADAHTDYAQAQRGVSNGKWQVGIYLPPGISAELHRRAMQLVQHGFSTADSNKELSSPSRMPLTINYFFDPAVQGGLQGAIGGMLRQLVASETLKIEMQALQKVLPAQIERQVSIELGPMFAQALAVNPININFPQADQPLLQAVVANSDDAMVLPTSVQHNVPAWSLFGIFFIVLPLSGVILQERSLGIFPRLQLIPGTKIGMLLGRLSAYLALAMAQFVVMVSVGYYVLPRLGTDMLQLNGQLPALLVVALCAGLTACGFGILLGTVAKSEQQAIMIAAVTIVISAALGGIMVPVYMMPPVMQTISVISPLGWGLDACQVLLLRGGHLQDILPQLLTMLSCCGICLLLAWRQLRQ